MKHQVARFLAPLTFLEWGGILTYFYVSGRLALFLHPHFRPMVLVTGILLLITAVCLLFSSADGNAQSAHDCEAEGCGFTHRKLTMAGCLTFLVLFLPIALAVKISPGTYGITLIQNRGVAETLDGVPGAYKWPVFSGLQQQIRSARSSATAKPTASASPVVYAGVNQPTPTSTPSTAYPPADAIPKGWNPAAPQFGQSVNVPDQELSYLTNDEVRATMRGPADANSRSSKRKAGGKSAPVLLAVNERRNAVTKFGSLKDLLDMADTPLREGGADGVKTAGDGKTLSLEVVDLLVAAQDPELVKQLEGKRVELTGQVLPGNGNSFRLLRLLVLCCSADAQPLAVRVEAKVHHPLAEMSWAKVAGLIHFVKHGNGVIPVVAADSVDAVKRPVEPYLY